MDGSSVLHRVSPVGAPWNDEACPVSTGLVGEVKSGYECGIGLEKFSDIKPGDVIEAFKVDKIVSKELYA